MNFLIRMVLRKLMRGAMKNSDFVGRRGQLGPRRGAGGGRAGNGAGNGAGSRVGKGPGARVAQRQARRNQPPE